MIDRPDSPPTRRHRVDNTHTWYCDPNGFFHWESEAIMQKKGLGARPAVSLFQSILIIFGVMALLLLAAGAWITLVLWVYRVVLVCPR